MEVVLDLATDRGVAAGLGLQTTGTTDLLSRCGTLASQPRAGGELLAGKNSYRRGSANRKWIFERRRAGGQECVLLKREVSRVSVGRGGSLKRERFCEKQNDEKV
jgi:hypothetical protein